MFIKILLLAVAGLMLLGIILFAIVLHIQKRKREKLYLKYPDYAFAVKQHLYAQHRYLNHRKTVLMPLYKSIKELQSKITHPLYSEHEELRQQSIRICRNHLQFEENISNELLNKLSIREKKIAELEKKYGIRA